MKKDSKINFINSASKEEIIDLCQKDLYAFLDDYAEFINYRTYTKLDADANLSKRYYNPLLILFALEDGEKNYEKFAKYFKKYIWKQERMKILKIKRQSNMTVEDLKTKLIKTLFNSNVEAASSLAKELFLKDSREFFKTLYNFAFMSKAENLKFLFVHALEKILSVNYYENILYATIYYLAKAEDDYGPYIAIQKNSKNIEQTEIFNKKLYNLALSILKSYDLANKEIFKSYLQQEFSQDFYINEDVREYFI